MTNVRQLRRSQEPAVDPNLTSKLVAKFGKKLMKEGFTGVPVLVQRYYRQVPGNARYDYDYEFDQETRTWIRIEESKRLVCEESHMTPTEYSIMADIWSYWWRGDSQPFPGIPDIATHVGKSVRQVKRYLFRMQESGWMLSISQYNVEGKQISNRYDFTPFLRKLVDYLESVGVLEKSDEAMGEGVIFTPVRGSEVPRTRGSEVPPKTNEIGEDSPEEDKSRIRRGAHRADLEKGGDEVPGAAIRNIEENKTRKTSIEYENKQYEETKPATPPNNGGAEAAKGVNKDEKSKRAGLARRAEAMGITLEVYDALNAWLEECPKPAEDEDIWLRENMPELTSLRAEMSRLSKAFGNLDGKASNQTQGLKLYQYACTRRGLPEYRFYDCVCQAEIITNQKKKHLTKPMAYFFTTVKLHLLCALACTDLDPQPPTPSGEELVEDTPQGFAEEVTEEELVEQDGHASNDEQAPTEAEGLVEMFVTNDPAVGFSSQDITFWWADRLLNGVDPDRQLYRYQVYPTDKGKWGFVVFSKENEEDTWTFLSHHQVNEALHPAPEGSQN